VGRDTVVTVELDRTDVAVWAALLAAGLAFEWRELREGDRGVPLSRVLRLAFRTEHPAGALAFEALVLLGSRALVRHIVRAA
jgi:hypothetical protein